MTSIKGYTDLLVQGNFIGTEVTGTDTFGNSTAGISVHGQHTTILDNLALPAVWENRLYEAAIVGASIDGYGLTMIEQPFAPRDLLAHARFAASVDTAVCLDESVETLADLALAVHLQAGRVLNIKVSRMGGLTAAVAAHDAAQAAGWPVWCGAPPSNPTPSACRAAPASQPRRSGCTR